MGFTAALLFYLLSNTPFNIAERIVPFTLRLCVLLIFQPRAQAWAATMRR
ncbi:hypothetical protein GCM10007052_03270 [Halioglobus japonicus]|nr:hypothetical protein [Halioglobus japonicus]GHD07448.1 hypothetical protein GCM10007052_03270 [Halioglobus japonicus]